jgi:hypothetical protein
VVSKFLSQCLLRLGLIEVGRRRAGVTPLLLWAHDDGVWGGRGSALKDRNDEPERGGVNASR